jgi:hypothetical protein
LASFPTILAAARPIIIAESASFANLSVASCIHLIAASIRIIRRGKAFIRLLIAANGCSAITPGRQPGLVAIAHGVIAYVTV